MEWRELSGREMRNREKRADKPPFMVCKRRLNKTSIFTKSTDFDIQWSFKL